MPIQLRPSLLVLAVLTVTGCGGAPASSAAAPPPANGEHRMPAPSPEQEAEADAPGQAIFAGGCFWCMEPPFDKLDGVLETLSGYIGGHQDNPTYKQVSHGGTGHTEAVRVRYDPTKVTYGKLLEVFWTNIDPTVEDRQFCDWGDQYRTGIFVLNAGQEALATASKQTLEDSGRFEKVVTEVTAATTFYPAEDYHQDYYTKNPRHYKQYRTGCGRDRRLQELWGG